MIGRPAIEITVQGLIRRVKPQRPRLFPPVVLRLPEEPVGQGKVDRLHPLRPSPQAEPIPDGPAPLRFALPAIEDPALAPRLQEEDTGIQIRRYKGGAADRPPPPGLFPLGISWEIRHLAGHPVRMGKKGADLFSALVQEFLRSPDCQRIVLPAGQRLLPGIAVPEVSAPRLIGHPAERPVAEHHRPPHRGQGLPGLKGKRPRPGPGKRRHLHSA